MTSPSASQFFDRMASSLVRACTSSNSRTFSIAMTAWSAKVVDKLDLLVGEWAHLIASKREHANGVPSRSSGTPSMVRYRQCFLIAGRAVFGIGQTSGI